MKKGETLDKVYKSNLPGRAKQIMFYLINRANAEGTCFPSARTIASDCGVSERTIQRNMKVLLEKGFVIKENRYRENGGQSSNLYKLQVEHEINNNQTNGEDEKIKEEKIEAEEENNDGIDNIEKVTFDDYIEVNETKENNLNSVKQTVFNILVYKPPRDISFTIKTKRHHMLFKERSNTIDIFGKELQLNFLCHGVGDNLYPP
jgi:DNA-binding transcriptional regulator YhcF (GntR family)